MKRLIQWSLMGLAAAAAVTSLGTIAPSAIAQSPRVFEELDLTDEQQEDIRDIFAARREEISDVFTDDQRQQFRDAYEELQNFRAALGEVDTLTENQRDEIKEIMQGSRDEISEILTDEQREELRAIVQERRQNRQERGEQ